MFKYRYIKASIEANSQNKKKLDTFLVYVKNGLEGEDESLRKPYIYAKNNFKLLTKCQHGNKLVVSFKDYGISELSYFKIMIYWLEETFKALELNDIRVDYAIYDDEKCESTDKSFEIINKYQIFYFKDKGFNQLEFNTYGFAYKVASMEDDSLEIINDGNIILKSDHITLYEANIITKNSDVIINKYNALITYFKDYLK